MSRVFISYRRDDTRWIARALKGRLANSIGDEHIFMDIDSIEPGVDFVDVLEQAVAKVDALIAVIGPQFLTVTDDEGNRRIDNPHDFVRLEIATALNRDIRVIPLLEAGTPMPTEDELPEDLKPLARRNAVHVGDSSFESDIDRIVDSLERLWAAERDGSVAELTPSQIPGWESKQELREPATVVSPARAAESRSQDSQRWVIPVVSGVLLLAIIGVVVAMNLPRGAGDSAANDSSGREPSSSRTVDDTNAGRQESGAATQPVPDDSESPPVSPRSTAKNDEAANENEVSQSPPENEADVGNTDESTEPAADPEIVASGDPPVVEVIPESPSPEQPPAVDGMVWIPPGNFMMGSPADELARQDDETQHQVEITEGFLLGKYEITRAQYSAVMSNMRGQSGQSDLPVVDVSWNDAVQFCERLNAMSELPVDFGIDSLPPGYKFTLPTEAQWEYACRAGNARMGWDFEWQLYEMAVCYERNNPASAYQGPLVVGSRKPNAWGLYDMLGNVEEWCLDVYQEYTEDPQTDPVVRSGGNSHVMRGGSFASGVGPGGKGHTCRAAARAHQSFINPRCGFRVAAVKTTQSN